MGEDILIQRGLGVAYGGPYDAAEKYRVYSMVEAYMNERERLPESLRNRADMENKRLRILLDKGHGAWKRGDVNAALRELGHTTGLSIR